MKKKQLLLREEPIWDSSNPEQFLRCVNWYRANGKSVSNKKWTVEYLKKNKFNKKDIDFISKCPNGDFDMVGAYCRISTRSQSPVPSEDGWDVSLSKRLQRLIDRGKHIAAYEAQSEDNQTEEPKEKISIQDRIKDQVDGYIESIEKNIDYLIAQNGVPIAIEDFLKKNQIKSPQSKLIADNYRPILEELKEAYQGKCPDLKEGYSVFKKPDLRKLIQYVESIVSTCEEHSKLSASVRKPRTKKSKAPAQLVKNVKYQQKSEEFDIVSVEPRKIIGAKKVVVFNTKYRTIQIYEASSLLEDGLSVRGTTIVGFDDKKSMQKKVKDPKNILKTCCKSGIRAINNAYKSLTTKESTPNGRLNANCVILQVFK